MTCPQCGSSDVRRSRNPHWNDVFQRGLGRTPFRCRACRKRFYASFFYRSHSKQAVPSSTSKHSKRRVRAITRKRLGRLLVTGVVFAVAFIVFWIVLRYFMAMKNPA